MRNFAKTVFLTTQGTTARIDKDALRIERPEQPFVRVPLAQVESIVTHGHVNLTMDLMHHAARDGIDITMLSRAGRYIARLSGPTTGNILLRQLQFRAIDDDTKTRAIAGAIVAAKMLNERTVLLDAAKDRTDQAETLRRCADTIAGLAQQTRTASTMDQLRGIEGVGAKVYFDALSKLATDPRFQFERRTRRPPRDPMNALLSFTYALLRIRCVGALEAVGLDPQAGFLHTLRPGRPSLALDLMEEFRAPFAERHVLTLVNRRQLTTEHFLQRPGGACELTDQGRAALLTSWDAWLDGETTHRVYGHRMPRRHVPHHQALLLARHLRGDLGHYLPFRTTSR